MKIISLNTWGGLAGKENLLAFFDTYRTDIDVFCLQEIWSAPYVHLEGAEVGGRPFSNQKAMVYGKQEISALLSDHVSYFRPHQLDDYGLLMLAHKSLEVITEGELFVHKFKEFIPEGDVGLHGRNIQYIKTRYNNRLLTILNFHGLWNGKGKTDSEDRIEQSKRIIEFIQTIEGEIVFCGDFNLLPDTKSIQMLEEAGLRNLIKEYGVTSTRTSFYSKPEKFADYIFVSKGVQVKDFRVLPDEVSDHTPLYLEIV